VTKDIEGFSIKYWEKWPVYEYRVHDEQYLLEVDERMDLLAVTLFRGRLWPVSWVRPWGQGRVFYTALGHDDKACRNPFFRDLFVGGAKWAAEGKPYDRPKPGRFAIS
jgi:type 1 glutamine amidotransferase